MTKISKILLFAFTILCLITYISSVNALNVDFNYTGREYNFNNSNYLYTHTIVSNNTTDSIVQYVVNFDTPININENDKYLIFTYGNMFIQNMSYSKTINVDLTCNQQQSYWDSPTNQLYIRYADGTTANIVNYQELVRVCTEWKQSNINVQEQDIQFKDITYDITIMGNNTYTKCQKENGMLLCPVGTNTSFTGFVFRYRGTGTSYGYLENRFYLIRGASGVNSIYDTQTQTIINNQNQNAQQQHQDSQNINNSITSSDVSGNTSSDTITSISNTFDSENDFLLNLLTIPYTFWTSITNVFSNSCSALNVGTIFDKPLVFPCIELNDYLGSVFTTIIDVIFSGISMSAFVRRIIRYYQALLSLDNNASIIGGVKIW